MNESVRTVNSRVFGVDKKRGADNCYRNRREVDNVIYRGEASLTINIQLKCLRKNTRQMRKVAIEESICLESSDKQFCLCITAF